MDVTSFIGPFESNVPVRLPTCGSAQSHPTPVKRVAGAAICLGGKKAKMINVASECAMSFLDTCATSKFTLEGQGSNWKEQVFLRYKHLRVTTHHYAAYELALD